MDLRFPSHAPFQSNESKVSKLKDKFIDNDLFTGTVVGVDFGEFNAFGACSIKYVDGVEVPNSKKTLAIKSTAIKQPEFQFKNWMNRNLKKIKQGGEQDFYSSTVFKRHKFNSMSATRSEKDKAVSALFRMTREKRRKRKRVY